MSEKGLVGKGLFAYTLDHFESLKALLKYFNMEENHEFYENNGCV